MPSWCQKTALGWRLTLYIQPGAKKTACVGVHGEALKICLAAPPVEGKANAALLRFLADHLKLPLRQVQLVRGELSRHKQVEITGAWPDSAAFLAALAPSL